MSDEQDELARIVEARMTLRTRFQAESHATPSMSDPQPLGSGPPNRHGMPKLPIEQVATEKWPVLDLGKQPRIALERSKFVVDGACAQPVTLDWQVFRSLEQVEDVSDFHCVTKWSRFDVLFGGQRFGQDVVSSMMRRLGMLKDIIQESPLYDLARE